MAGVTKLRPAGQIRPAKPFHPARVDILPMRKNIITKENLLIWQKHFLKQSHFVRCPALGLLSNSLCGPRTKTFGDPWSMATSDCAIITDVISVKIKAPRFLSNDKICGLMKVQRVRGGNFLSDNAASQSIPFFFLNFIENIHFSSLVMPIIISCKVSYFYACFSFFTELHLGIKSHHLRATAARLAWLVEHRKVLWRQNAPSDAGGLPQLHAGAGLAQ